jgi:hypothetical protein
LFVPFLILLPYGPFSVSDFNPVTGGNPMVQTLILLAGIVGIPFFVVSTTAPLLQKWFGHTGHPAAKDPYFLYGASNLGSMLALLAYPPIFELFLGLEAQSWFYTFGYMALVGVVMCCGLMAFKALPTVQLPGKKREEEPEHVPSMAPEPPAEPVGAAAQMTAPPETAVTSAPMAPKPTMATGIKKGGKKFKGRDLSKSVPAGAIATPATAAALATRAPLSPPGRGVGGEGRPDADEITWPRRLRWIGLAAVPSSLMLGVTVYMSTDISAIPLFWVLPLALYLFSFILVFMRWPFNWLENAHYGVLIAQPILLAVLALYMAHAVPDPFGGVVNTIIVMLLAFTATALACHGEMAKDRPSATHLTEFYLLMSVGGAVGGLFNGIIAPIIFPWGIVEFGLALTVAGLLRPTLLDRGWTESLLAGLGEPADTGRPHHGKGGKKIAKATAEAGGLTLVLDFALPFGVLTLLAILLYWRGLGGSDHLLVSCIVPVICTACFLARPLRFGLSLGAILLLTGYYLNSSGEIIFQTRSYFGVLRVREYPFGDNREGHSTFGIPFNNLMHGTTDHGLALQPTKAEDASRVATTYYHRQGPVGICMERFNWFPKEYLEPIAGKYYWNELFWGDARAPVSLSGMQLGLQAPFTMLVGAWAEPPYAVIGMGTATMSSYARPTQTCHFYEIDEQIRLMSLPEKGGTAYFGYVKAALKRGANVQVLMGDARLRMAMPWIPKDSQDKKPWEISFDERGGPENFYHLMVVDAFSSDAIPRHLITKEAMEMYFKHLVQGHWVDVDPSAPRISGVEYKDNKMWVPGGVLCVHTSNRHLRLVPVVTDTAAVAEWEDIYDRDADGKPKKITGLVANRGHDTAPGLQYLDKKEDIGHYTSEWVIVARDLKDIKHLQAPKKYNEWMKEAHARKAGVPEYEEYWTPQTPTRRYIWTDDHTNLMAVFRWPWSKRGD